MRRALRRWPKRASRQILTLPMFPAMTEADVARVVEALESATA